MKSTATKRSGNAKSGAAGQGESFQNSEDRLDCIATSAYYKAEARGFEPGQDLDDWLTAEAEFPATRG